jgi:hypothetical protein
MNFAAVFGILAVAVLLDAWATYVIVRDELSSQSQRLAQLALVWLVPFIGSLLTLYFKRSRTELPTGHYRETRDPGDDFAYSAQSVRQTKEAIEAGHAGAGETGGTE